MKNFDLINFRQQIDDIDSKIIDLLYKRFEIVEEVSETKKNLFGNEFLYIDPTREYELIKNKILFGNILDIEPNLMKNLYRNLISYSNFHEQPALKINIHKNSNKKILQMINEYYPISMCYTEYKSIQMHNFLSSDIICIDYQSLPNIAGYLFNNLIHIYHIESCKTTHNKVAFCGKIYKLYSKEDGIFIFFNKNLHLTESCNHKKYLNLINDENFLFLGSSSSLII